MIRLLLRWGGSESEVLKKGSGTFAGTARRVLRTKVPDPFFNTSRGMPPQRRILVSALYRISQSPAPQGGVRPGAVRLPPGCHAWHPA